MALLCHPQNFPVNIEIVAPPEVIIHHPARYNNIARLNISVDD